MKKYWRSITHAGFFALSITALVVATQSGTAQEVHQVASKSPKQETISYDSFAIDKQTNLYLNQQNKLAMNNEDEILTLEKRVVMNEQKISNAQFKAEPAKEEKIEVKTEVAKVHEQKSEPKPVESKPAPQPKAEPKPQAQPKPQPKPTPAPQQTNDSFYVKGISMPYEHQKYLYEMTQKRGLDYKETLAFIGHESEFNPNAKGGNNYGYFQISSVNHDFLAKTLGTKNAPFDPYVNINWGTHMISELYKKYGNKEAVLSAYSKGEGGYAKTGVNIAYVKKHNQVLSQINTMS